MREAGYEPIDELSKTSAFTVRRARRESDGRPVLVKALRNSVPVSDDTLRSEFDCLRRLALRGLPRAIEIAVPGRAPLLVLEDDGSRPLAETISRGAVDCGTFLDIAIQIVTTWVELDRCGASIRGFEPGGILVHPRTREVVLLDIQPEAGRNRPPATSECAALPFLAPEQIGRMNRSVDFRSGFYRLGLTFYELLTGSRPFRTDDPLELIHAHIARNPEPPAALQPRVPPVVSRLVLKLLKKSPEARYQSAAGLLADLERCAHEWNAFGTVHEFVLGERDVSERLVFPRTLYGRDREARQLEEAFRRASNGETRCVLVSGYAGVGKTSLVRQLYGTVVAGHGLFVSGKFDQVVRDIPFGALIEAFRGLARQLVAEGDRRLAQRRARLAEALGVGAGVLTAVIPELEWILGPQPAPAELPPAESQNRFRFAFQSFAGALTDPEHSLVLFLDDLQWADPASLTLVQALLTNEDMRSLLVLGAFRDGEIGAGHPLPGAIEAIAQSGVAIERLPLEPLDVGEVKRLISDALRRNDDETSSLGALAAKKTGGNPFFLVHFLNSLEQEGLIFFERGRRRWELRLADIESAPMTDNVIDLMTRRIRRLSPEAQHVLTLAACVGGRFDLPTLATVRETSADRVEAALREAIGLGLVLESADNDGPPSYAFLHDRVQQSAYSALPGPQRRELHLRIGRLLLGDRDDGDTIDNLFDVVSHLNAGRALITEDGEQLRLARLNFVAGRRAKRSTAFEAALDYFRTGIELAPRESRDSDYELFFELHYETAECEYLCGRLAEAARTQERLVAEARSDYDHGRVYLLRLAQLESEARYSEAATAGREGLSLLGVDFPVDETAKQEAIEAAIREIDIRLAGRRIDELAELPVLADRRTRLVMRLLTTLWAPAYISGDAKLVALISARLVLTSIEHGNSEDSAYGYVTHAITVGPLRGEYAQAYEWGTLALAVNEALEDDVLRAKVHQQFNAHVTLWRRPIATCIPHAQEACRSGLQSGDFTYAGYGAFTQSWPDFVAGNSLDDLVASYGPSVALLKRIHHNGLAAAQTAILQWAEALRGGTERGTSLSGAAFEEAAFQETYATNPFFMTVFHVAKLRLAFLFEDIPGALRAARAAWQLGPWGKGTIWPVLLHFWGALAAAAAFPRARAEEAGALRQMVVDALAVFGPLADSCAENFRCYEQLLLAELHRIDGEPDAAARGYDEAVSEARSRRQLPHLAVALEACARFWRARGNSIVSSAYLREARDVYRQWGATAKVRHIEDRHPELLSPEGATSSPDLLSVTRAAHALAVEIVQDSLLRKLMTLAIENAGAQRGVFLTASDGGFTVVAEGDTEIGARVLDPAEQMPARSFSNLVVHHVERTGESVVIDDSTSDTRFDSDPYLSAGSPMSVLCIPVMYQGRTAGVLYLENGLTPGAFTADRVEVLGVLSAQAAIALENARLFRERAEETEQRKRAESELRLALAEVERLKDRLHAENAYLQEEIRREHNFEEMVGNSRALIEVLGRVERVAPTDATVLVTGETGTGKELIVRALHSRSPRKDRPLVKVNCAALTSGLIESELFGHARGAFTGAIGARVGRFELAHEGTIFLDEIGELPLETQAKLLRVLQEREFEPVGASRTVRVDVRVIAATNRDLIADVQRGRFRADLFYRLNVFPLSLPPLRDRRSDVPVLASYFLSRFARRFGRKVAALSEEAMAWLMQYEWPGNVRELENLIERAVVLAAPAAELLGLDHFPSAGPPPRVGAAEPEPPSAGEDVSLESWERRHILRILRRTNGVVDGPNGAGALLKLKPSTLRSRMKKLGIRRPYETC